MNLGEKWKGKKRIELREMVEKHANEKSVGKFDRRICGSDNRERTTPRVRGIPIQSGSSLPFLIKSHQNTKSLADFHSLLFQQFLKLSEIFEGVLL